LEFWVFKFEEIEKLVLIEFKTDEKFDRYIYDEESKNGIFVDSQQHKLVLQSMSKEHQADVKYKATNQCY
jgi:hypothetical protein